MFSQVYKDEVELLQLLSNGKHFFQVQGAHLGSSVDRALFHHLTDIGKKKKKNCRQTLSHNGKQKNSCVRVGQSESHDCPCALD